MDKRFLGGERGDFELDNTGSVTAYEENEINEHAGFTKEEQTKILALGINETYKCKEGEIDEYHVMRVA